MYLIISIHDSFIPLTPTSPFPPFYPPTSCMFFKFNNPSPPVSTACMILHIELSTEAKYLEKTVFFFLPEKLLSVLSH